MGFFERHERAVITAAMWLWVLDSVLWFAFLIPLDWLHFVGCQVSPVP